MDRFDRRPTRADRLRLARRGLIAFVLVTACFAALPVVGPRVPDGVSVAMIYGYVIWFVVSNLVIGVIMALGAAYNAGFLRIPRFLPQAPRTGPGFTPLELAAFAAVIDAGADQSERLTRSWLTSHVDQRVNTGAGWVIVIAGPVYDRADLRRAGPPSYWRFTELFSTVRCDVWTVDGRIAVFEFSATESTRFVDWTQVVFESVQEEGTDGGPRTPPFL